MSDFKSVTKEDVENPSVKLPSIKSVKYGEFSTTEDNIQMAIYSFISMRS